MIKYSTFLVFSLIFQLLSVSCLSEKPPKRISNILPQGKKIEAGFLAKDLDSLTYLPEGEAIEDATHGIKAASNVLAEKDVSLYGGGAWKVIGAGLLKLVKFLEVVIKGTCLSISEGAKHTCGGLKPDTCGRLEALRKSVAALKSGAKDAIERNDDLMRWNATNVHLGLKMRSIAQEIDDIVIFNAGMMDLSDTMNYHEKSDSIDKSEMVDESGSSLARMKLHIHMKPLEFIKKVTRELNVANMNEGVKDKIAFGVALGISMSSQCVPDLLRGMKGLSEEIVGAQNSLLVILESADTGVTFGYQYATERQFFFNVTRGAAETILADAQSTGLSGFFDLFVDTKIADKVTGICLKDGNRVRVERGASADFLRRLNETNTMERLVEITKTMKDVDFDKFIRSASTRDPFQVLKDLEIAEIPSNPHGLDVAIVKKLAKGFKKFEKFFTDVKKSLNVASQRFEESGMTWNKIGYYGFSALAQFARFANVALCVMNIITTVEGARQMRIKIDTAEVETAEALKDIEEANKKGEKLLEMQKSLNGGVMADLKKLGNFMANPLQDNEQVPAEFRIRVDRVQKHLRVWCKGNMIRDTSVAKAEDLNLYMRGIRSVMQGFYNRMYSKARIVQMAMRGVEIQVIRDNMKQIGQNVTDVFHALSLLASSEQFEANSTYDSFPLDCIREGSIGSEEELRSWFDKTKAPLVPIRTKKQIETLVDFWDQQPSTIVNMLWRSQHLCHSPSLFAHDDSLAHVKCSLNDVLSVIANYVLPNKEAYHGVDLKSFRSKYLCPKK